MHVASYGIKFSRKEPSTLLTVSLSSAMDNLIVETKTFIINAKPMIKSLNKVINKSISQDRVSQRRENLLGVKSSMVDKKRRKIGAEQSLGSTYL